MFTIFDNRNETILLFIRLLVMNLKPLYRTDNSILIGLKSDFTEVCVLDGLVVEIDLEGKKILSGPESGLRKLKSGSYKPIRQHEKKEYARVIEKKLKRRLIRKIEEELIYPARESIDTLTWIPDRLAGNSNA